MEIKLKANYGYDIIITAENVNISEDIESRNYHKTEDGKTDFTRSPIRDISTDALDMFSGVLSDMIYYRVADYDSTDLISSLVDKLPDNERQELIKKLHKDWIEE